MYSKREGPKPRPSFYTIQLNAGVEIVSGDEQGGEDDDDKGDEERDGNVSEGEKRVESRKSEKEHAGIRRFDDARRGGVHSPDRWTCRGQGLAWVREHRAPRASLFHPSDAERGPASIKGLWHIRKTEGTMADGRKFMITDAWDDDNGSAENELRRLWTGRTTFIMRTPSNKFQKMRAIQHERM